jgi:hypothetical protein
MTLPAIRPQHLNVGVSPDYEGVLIVINPEQPEQLIISLPADAALGLSDGLRKYAQKLMAEGQSGAAAQPQRQSTSIAIKRERGAKPDA